jgi:hypothetical protein
MRIFGIVKLHGLGRRIGVAEPSAPALMGGSRCESSTRLRIWRREFESLRARQHLTPVFRAKILPFYGICKEPSARQFSA